jgi:hypothetical protein
MQRVIFIALCLVYLPCLTGCIIPYAFPKVDFTRALQLDVPQEDARFYRVDKSQITWPYPVFVKEQLSQIPVTKSGKVAAQFKPSFRNGIYLFMGALNYDYGQGRHLAVRAYRPGFELVEIESTEQVDRIDWIPAEDLAAQERAIDSLVPLETYWSDHIIPAEGSSSTAHRDALLFGAAEYERLAAIAPSPEENTRLLQKASKLKQRAEE